MFNLGPPTRADARSKYCVQPAPNGLRVSVGSSAATSLDVMPRPTGPYPLKSKLSAPRPGLLGDALECAAEPAEDEELDGGGLEFETEGSGATCD